jgi:hypothetical protein
MIKLAHRPVRYGAGHVRIGGIVPGIRGDLIDRDGWVWALLSLLDGTRTVERIATEMAVTFPAVSRDTVRTAVAELAAAGHVEDAVRTDHGLSVELRERHSPAPGGGTRGRRDLHRR